MKPLHVVVVVGLVIAGCDSHFTDSSSELDDHALRHAFIPTPDAGGGTDYPCDTFVQDCPAGEKCMPWANDGGSAWNATRCSPVVSDPGGPGEPCTVDGSGVSGLDDCERGAFCFDVDPMTNGGTCLPMVTGSANHPLCADPMRTPTISAEGVLNLCLASCRPLQNDCAQGQGCYPSFNAFTCVPDSSGAGGNAGDVCEFVNACSSGLACVLSDVVPGCEGAGCCTPYCDTAAPSCPEGLTCQPWPGDPTPLPGGENLGICSG